MKEIQIRFKFDIGDVVLPRAVYSHYMDRKTAMDNMTESERKEERWLTRSGKQRQVRWVICGREYEECYNTFQIHYSCKMILSDGDSAKERDRKFSEFELEACPFDKDED